MRDKKREKGNDKFKKEIAEEKNRSRLKSKTDLNKTESLEGDNFLILSVTVPFTVVYAVEEYGLKNKFAYLMKTKLLKKVQIQLLLKKLLEIHLII